jgi:hypothetical protein
MLKGSLRPLTNCGVALDVCNEGACGQGAGERTMGLGDDEKRRGEL